MFDSREWIVNVTTVKRPADSTPAEAVSWVLPAVAAGFPSPAQDYFSGTLDLNEHLFTDRQASHILTVAGHSMVGAGIWDGDKIIVDRSLDPRDGSIVVAVVDGELTVKRLRLPRGGRPELHPENQEFPVIRLREHSELNIWGVVTWVLHHV